MQGEKGIEKDRGRRKRRKGWERKRRRREGGKERRKKEEKVPVATRSLVKRVDIKKPREICANPHRTNKTIVGPKLYNFRLSVKAREERVERERKKPFSDEPLPKSDT